MNMSELLTAFLLIVGSGFCMIAGIGVLRMPDLFTRMQASAKAGTLGVGCIVLGVATNFQDLKVAAEASLIIAFLFLTAPIASHLIARAAYFAVDTKNRRLEHDELAGCYDPDTHTLASERPKDGVWVRRDVQEIDD